MSVRIPAGKHAAFRFDSFKKKMVAVNETENVSNLAASAISKCPEWIRDDLKEKFSRLDANNQERYAKFILGITGKDKRKYLDEIVFCVAHLSTEILTHKSFDPEILKLNARLIYEYAKVLPYVEIVEKKGFTTLKYKVKEPLKDAPRAINEDEYKKLVAKWTALDNKLKKGEKYNKSEYEKLSKQKELYKSEGVKYTLGADKHVVTVRRAHPEGFDTRPVTTYTIPRDIYYWYVVHPACFTELPMKVDNKFWREYFFGAKGLSLRELLSGAKLVWDGIAQTGRYGPYRKEASVLERLVLWANNVLPEKKYPNERVVQPVKCFDWHGGSCTENQTILTPGSRTALIPVASVRNTSENHQWNEFWLFGHWLPLQAHLGKGGYLVGVPGNFQDKDYSGYKNVSAISLVRGDGYIIDRTKDYTRVCTVDVQVVAGKDGRPVDSCLVEVWTPYWPNKKYDAPTNLTPHMVATYAYTDDSGRCRFLLGEGRDYKIDVKGCKPFIISDSKADATYNNQFKADIDLKQPPKVMLQDMPNNGKGKQIQIMLTVDAQIMYGKLNTPDFRRAEVRSKYAQKKLGGSVDAYLCDKLNYKLFEAGKPFRAYAVFEGKNQATIKMAAGSEFYLVVRNPAREIKKCVSVFFITK